MDLEEYKLKHLPCVLCLIENPESNQLLMVRNLRGMNKGYCNFPGGKIDLGETIPEAVRREVKEETGLSLKQSRCIGRIDIAPDGLQDHPDRFSTDDDIHVYLFYSDKYRGELSPAEGEVELFWCDKDKIPYDQMRDNDRVWLPEVLEGKTIHKTFFRGQDGKLKETEHDDEDVESMLAFRMRQYEFIKMAYGRK